MPLLRPAQILRRLIYVLALAVVVATPEIQAAKAAAKAEAAGITPAEQNKFDKFLDDHPVIADALIQHPGKADGKEFLKTHPAYATFIADHPKIAQDIKAHPRAFVERFLKREDSTPISGEQAKLFGAFLGDHPKIEAALSEDAAQLKDPKFVKGHPELLEFLDKHPGIAGEAAAKPVRLFIRAELAMNKSPE